MHYYYVQHLRNYWIQQTVHFSYLGPSAVTCASLPANRNWPGPLSAPTVANTKTPYTIIYVGVITQVNITEHTLEICGILNLVLVLILHILCTTKS